jgi:hypothetical protein
MSGPGEFSRVESNYFIYQSFLSKHFLFKIKRLSDPLCCKHSVIRTSFRMGIARSLSKLVQSSPTPYRALRRPEGSPRDWHIFSQRLSFPRTRLSRRVVKRIYGLTPCRLSSILTRLGPTSTSLHRRLSRPNF